MRILSIEIYLQCSIPAFEGLLPEPYNTILITLLYRTAEWHALAKLRLHTESTLDHLKKLTKELGHLMRKFRDTASEAFATFELPRETEARKQCEQAGKGKENTGMSGSGSHQQRGLNLMIYKWHALSDYVCAIRLFGGTDGFSTQVVSNIYIYMYVFCGLFTHPFVIG